MGYLVKKSFIDFKDDDRIYKKGDKYLGTKATRIKELLSDDHKGRHEKLVGQPLIEFDGVEETE